MVTPEIPFPSLEDSVRNLIRWVKAVLALTALACVLQFGVAIGVVEGAGKAATRLGALRDENASIRKENASLREELNKLRGEGNIPDSGMHFPISPSR